MLETPKCWTRKCKHFLGVLQPDGTEENEWVYCKAFPEGIPEEIAYGDNPHAVTFPGQKNKIVYEKKGTDENFKPASIVKSMTDTLPNERKLIHAIALIYGQQVIDDVEFCIKHYDVIDRYAKGILTMQLAPIRTLEAVALDPASVPGWTHSLATHPEDCGVLKEFFARLIRYYGKIGRT